jgi:hypothetical protein
MHAVVVGEDVGGLLRFFTSQQYSSLAGTEHIHITSAPCAYQCHFQHDSTPFMANFNNLQSTQSVDVVGSQFNFIR